MSTGSIEGGIKGAIFGAISAGSSGILGDMSNRSSAAIARRTAIAATAGGIAAELGGGKFSNGARTAAFVHLFNAEGIARPRPDWEDLSVEERRIGDLTLKQYSEQMSPVGYTGGEINADLSKFNLVSQFTKAKIDNLRELVLSVDVVPLVGSKSLGVIGNILNVVTLYKFIPNREHFQFQYQCSGVVCNLEGFSVINE